jgi:hypothetical protein
MTTATASAKQKLVDRIKECVRQGKVKFHDKRGVKQFTGERENSFTCSVSGASGQELCFGSIANTETKSVPSEYGPMVDSHETDYALLIFGDGKGMTKPALTFRTSDDHPEQGREAREVNELLAELWQADLKRSENSRKTRSSEQEEMVAERLLRELDEEPHDTGG